MTRRRLLVLWGLLALAFAPLASGAQGESGTIEVVVTDASGKNAVAGARVILDGPFIAQEVTGSDGRVAFEAAPSGIYRARVLREGYAGATTEPFDVLPERVVSVVVHLSREEHLLVIASITVRPLQSLGEASVGEESSARKLSAGLGGALGKLGGVLVTSGDDAQGPTETIWLEGHDPTQTALSLDGIPLNAPGQALDLRALNPDLFASASISHAPTATALGGSIDFRTLEPTLRTQVQTASGIDSNDGSYSTFSSQGSAGRLGFAAVHTVRGYERPLAGLPFGDTSGLTYVHGGSYTTGGDLLKLRLRLGASQTITATGLSSRYDEDALCSLFTGPLPCGYGPGNRSSGHFGSASLTDTLLLGSVGLKVAVFRTASRGDQDFSHRYVGGVLSPLSNASLVQTQGADLEAEFPGTRRHTLTLSGTATRTEASQLQSGPASTPLSPSVRTSYAWMTLTDTVRANPRLRLSFHGGAARATPGGGSLTAGMSAGVRAGANNAVLASFDLNGIAPEPVGPRILSDPTALRFSCSAGLAFGEGPGDAPGSSSSSSARLVFEHRAAQGLFEGVLYRQEQHGALIQAPVNGAALPAGYFPPGYFQAASATFASPGGCGSATALGPANVYVVVPIAGTRRIYEGLRLSALRSVGRHVTLGGYAAVEVAKVLSDDPRLTAQSSPVISGSQLPNVPLHHAGLIFDYRAPRLPIEVLADAQYTSANNPANLPAYVTFDVAASIATPRATLTAFIGNLFDVYAGRFATPTGAVPLATAGGRLLPSIAFPLQPRTLGATLRFKLGKGVSGPAEPGPVGLIQPLPHTPPLQPLLVDQTRSICGPADARVAQATTEGLRAYAAALERAKSGTGYPGQAPAEMPAVPGIAPVYHRLANSYALTLRAVDIEAAQALFRCVPLHVGTEGEARALGLYVPEATAFARFTLVFSPLAGIYVVRPPEGGGREAFRLYRLPTAAPKAPLAVESRAECTAELRAAAVQLLPALERYVAAFDPQRPPPAQPEGWRVTPHAAAAGWWLAVVPENFSNLPAVLNCGHVAVAAEDELRARGYDGVAAPSLNFAPPVGLYLVRPER
ncbi:TonB-dependent receptor [bacterium]|nr:MAG: TonB-dependent receptor [bacterium]